MVRTGPSKNTDATYTGGRLANARAFLHSAREALALAGPDANGNPICTLAVTAAIAYTDALTSKFKSKVNQQDHSSSVALLRAALGNRIGQRQISQLTSILSVKDDVEYGAKIGRMEQAARIMDALEGFAAWAEETLS